MIIAWILFVIGCYGSVVFFMEMYRASIKTREHKINVWLYFIIAVCSAQYIWG